MRNIAKASRAPLLIAAAFLLAGCEWLGGELATGGARYEYVRTTADGSCTIDIVSGRNAAGPASAQITDCDLRVDVSSLEQGRQFSLGELLQLAAALKAADVQQKEKGDGSDAGN